MTDTNEHKENLKTATESTKSWTTEADKFLFTNFLGMTDESLAAELGKPIEVIGQQREDLGLMRPRIVQRTTTSFRIQKIVFHLKAGQKISGKVKVDGGKKDIIYGFFQYQGRLSKLSPNNQEKIVAQKNYSYQISTTGSHCFYFSNAISLITSKTVEFIYRVGNGKKVSITFKI
ncbi:MAG: hypothetical protein NWF01_07610 [Candidatus Bathyarchaeota archaeon]|nr:hypothetical protein [Candidatus Bathyarchaeota archaeon]